MFCIFCQDIVYKYVIRYVHSLKNIFQVHVSLVSSKKEINEFQLFAARDIRNLYYVYIFCEDIVYTYVIRYEHSLKNIFKVRMSLVSSKKEINKFQLFAAQDIRNLHYVYTVSYTHLDVYKRQVYTDIIRYMHSLKIYSKSACHWSCLLYTSRCV